MPEHTQVDVDQLMRAARSLGEGVDKIGRIGGSFHVDSRMAYAFGSSPEGERVSSQFRAMHGSLWDMITNLHSLGMRHREALESASDCYRKTQDGAIESFRR